MKVVVTGGVGFVGSHVAEHYALRGHQVVVVDNQSRARLLGHDTTIPLDNGDFISTLPNTHWIKEDVRNLDALCSILEGADVVIHTAGQTAVTTSLTNPMEDFSVNAIGTLNVLEAARRTSSPPVVIFCSTNKVYGSRVNNLPIVESERRYVFDGSPAGGIGEDLGVDLCEHTPYGCSKLAADLYAQDYARVYGLRVGVFRMSCIYGPRQFGLEDQGWVAWFAIATLLDRPLTIYGDGKQVRDVLYVTDLVAAFDAFVESDLPLGVFNMGGGPSNTLSLLELLEILEDLVGRKPRVSFSEWRPGDQKVYISDIGSVRAALGWIPAVPPANGIRSLVEWTRQNLTLLSRVL